MLHLLQSPTPAQRRRRVIARQLRDQGIPNQAGSSIGSPPRSRGNHKSLLRDDLIILDELGFAPQDDTGTQLLFRLVAGAYERRSLAIGSHWPFEQWGRFLPEQTTAVSILDRLLHHATVVITDGQSYRMKDAQHRKENR